MGGCGGGGGARVPPSRRQGRRGGRGLSISYKLIIGHANLNISEAFYFTLCRLRYLGM